MNLKLKIMQNEILCGSENCAAIIKQPTSHLNPAIFFYLQTLFGSNEKSEFCNCASVNDDDVDDDHHHDEDDDDDKK